MERLVGVRDSYTVLILLLMLVTCVPTVESSPELSIDFIVPQGPAGTIVELLGSGATPGGEVEILFNDESVTLTNAYEDGYFYATFIVPDVPLGLYTVTAVDEASEDTASTIFEVIESKITIEIDPDVGIRGTRVYIWGEMATPGGEVEIYLDEIVLAGTTASPDPNGFYYTDFIVPDVPPRVYNVTALDVSSGSNATAYFEVLPPPELSLSPSEGPMGTKVTVSGKGFGSPMVTPYTYVFFEDHLEAYGRLDENGDFTVRITVPAVATGTYEIKAGFEPGIPIESVTFNVTFGIDSLFSQLDTMGSDIEALNAKITSIEGNVVTVQTDLGELKGRVTSIEAGIVTLETDVGTLKLNIITLNAKITSVEGDVVTIKTDLGEIKGRVTSIEGNIATIETDIGRLKVEVPQQFEALMESTQEEFGSVITYELAIMILALIAAIGAWMALIIVWRKSKSKVRP